MDRFRVNQGSSYLVFFDIVDVNGDPVSDVDLTVATLTLADVMTAADGSPNLGIINTREDQNILNAHNVTIDTHGHLMWSVQPEDNIIVTSRRQVERHHAFFHFEWDGGSLNYECEIDVVNLHA